jgi:hypothetical protein
MRAIEATPAGRVSRYELVTGGTGEGDPRLHHGVGYVDIGWRSRSGRAGSRVPGKAGMAH